MSVTGKEKLYVSEGDGRASVSVDEIKEFVESDPSGTVAWDNVTGKPATFPATVPVATATALATGRTFALTGGATGTSGAFTGAANASIPVVLATPGASLRGGVLQGAAVANATDEASAVTQLNALLASLRASGAIGT